MKKTVILWLLLALPALALEPVRPGTVLDNFNGVQVYFNGSVNDTHGRNMAGGYNLGLKYQCVEFIKRYYYERFNHKMPETYGHAKDFFDPSVKDSGFNKPRGLVQYTNGSLTKPQAEDILVMHKPSGSDILAVYGHVAIISGVTDADIEIVQQNMSQPRMRLPLEQKDGRWYVNGFYVLGWLRLPEAAR